MILFYPNALNAVFFFPEWRELACFQIWWWVNCLIICFNVNVWSTIFVIFPMRKTLKVYWINKYSSKSLLPSVVCVYVMLAIYWIMNLWSFFFFLWNKINKYSSKTLLSSFFFVHIMVAIYWIINLWYRLFFHEIIYKYIWGWNLCVNLFKPKADAGINVMMKGTNGGTVVAQWIRPWTLNQEVAGSNRLAVAVLLLGKALAKALSPCLAPQRGLKFVCLLDAYWRALCVSGQDKLKSKIQTYFCNVYLPTIPIW